MNFRRGFTVLELLVVIAVIGILSGVVMISVSNSRDKSRIAAGEKFAQHLRFTYGSGWVLKYNFESDLSGKATDLSGLKNDGNIIGQHSYVEGYQKGNKAIRLNGGYIQLPSNLKLNSDIIISVRFKMNRDLYWQRLIDFGNGTSQNLFLTTKSNRDPNINNPRFAVTISGASGEKLITSNKNLKTDKWYHLAIVVYSKENKGIMYLDGEEVGIINNLGLFANNQQLSLVNNYIGKSQYSWDPNFDGAIDYVEIFNNPITER